MVRWLPGGAVQMGLVWANYLGRDAPALSAVLVQGVGRKFGRASQGAANDPGNLQTGTGRLGYRDCGFHGLPLLKASIFCRDEPVRTLDDLKKKKLRVWSKDQVETFTKLGVPAQIVGQNDLYVALQTGVVDCAVLSRAVRPHDLVARSGQIRVLPLSDCQRPIRPGCRQGSLGQPHRCREGRCNDGGCSGVGTHQRIHQGRGKRTGRARQAHRTGCRIPRCVL